MVKITYEDPGGPGMLVISCVINFYKFILCDSQRPVVFHGLYCQEKSFPRCAREQKFHPPQ